MSDAVDISPTKRRFSAASCLGAALFHFIVTFALLEYYWSSSLRMYFPCTTFEITFWRVLLWIWTPPIMATKGWEGENIFQIAGIWSCVVGVFIGLLSPVISRWIQRQLAPVATTWEQNRNTRLGVIFRVFGRLSTLSVRRKTLTLIASALIIMGILFGGWRFYRRFILHDRSHNLRDSFIFNLASNSIKTASLLTIYEGLPRQNSETSKLVDELATQRTIKIGPYPFYEQPLSISPKEIEDLRSLVTSADAYMAYGPKLCGGFHPDYGLVWSDGSNTCYVLICFGCHEVIFYDTKHTILWDIRDEVFSKFETILRKYHIKPPKRD